MTLDSSLLKTTPSTASPIAIMTSITAMIWDTSVRERAAYSRCPSPRNAKSSSAPMTPLQANAHPCLNPDIM